MKKWFCFAVTALIVLTLNPVFSADSNKVKLEYKPSAGTELNYVSEIKIKNEMVNFPIVQEGAVNPNQETGMKTEHVQKIEKVNEDGTIEEVIVFKSMETSVDTREYPDESALLKKEIRVKKNKFGRIIEMKSDSDEEQDIPAISPTGLPEFSSSIVFPDRFITTGDSWTQEEKTEIPIMPDMPTTMKISANFTLLGFEKVNDRECARIKTILNISTEQPENSGEVSEEEPVMLVTADFSGSGEAIALIRCDDGILVSSKGDVKMTIKMTYPNIEGMEEAVLGPMEMKMIMGINTTLK